MPIKNRSKEELLWAVTDVYAWQMARGYWPLLHKMDKETSHDVEAFIASEQGELKYTLLDIVEHSRLGTEQQTDASWGTHILEDTSD